VSCAGIACATDKLCSRGACQPVACGATPCPAGQVCVQASCVDAACAGAHCQSGRCVQGECKSCQATETNCSDGVDDDCNGATDCADSACAGQPCSSGSACANPGTCVGGACAASTPKPSSVVCRPAVDVCDLAEKCDGTSLDCPTDLFAPSTTSCPTDGNPCATSVCDGKGACTHPAANELGACATNQICHAGVCQAGCGVSGAFYAPDAKRPGNSCQLCTPSASTTAWTFATDGTDCGGGQICAGGACGTGCVINSVSYATGAANPGNPCQSCQPGVSTSAWSDMPEGFACPGSKLCHTGACTSGCFIAGAFVASGAANPANSCQKCDPAHDTVWTNADGISCGGGKVCSAGLCSAGCWIASAFWFSTAPNPANACQDCEPGKSTTAWSSRASGVSCSGTDYCTSDTRNYSWQCDGAGTCHTVASQACATAGQCQTGGGCASGACVAVVNKGAGASCTGTDFCTSGTRNYNWQCDPGGGCNATSTQACATANQCQTGGGCSGGACVAVVNKGTGTACSGTDYCTSGTRYYNWQCDSGASCNPASSLLCPTPANACQAGGGCSGGACVAVTLVTDGTHCGTCASCAAGSCAYNSTLNADCGFCQKCTGLLTCGNQLVTEDLKGECAASGPPTCSTDNCNGAGACGNTARTCYNDADLDGYTSGSFVKCSACNGTTEKTSPSALSDCCDTDASAHPGQAGWFIVQDACSSFDYDCSGSTEKQYSGGTDLFYPTCMCPGSNCQPGPVGGIPRAGVACGVAGTPNYVSCPGSCGTCSTSGATNSPWTQGCH